MNTVNLKRNDTKGIFNDVLTVDGVAVNLSGILFLYFILRKPEKSIKQIATVTNAATGAVSYQPVAADVNASGKYRQEWEVVFADSRPLTFPNGDYNEVNILSDLG